jgi:putative flippase GtrA
VNTTGVWRTTGKRWCKFSLVGAIGIGVQLGALAALTAAGVHYLLATGLAVEAAVLHNFVLHQSFTWSDRGGAAGVILGRLARFHLTNGAIYVLGNLALMRLLVGHFGLPTLPANLASIAVCSLANFLAADRVVFLGGWPAGARSVGEARRHIEATYEPEREWASPMSSTVRCEKGT